MNRSNKPGGKPPGLSFLKFGADEDRMTHMDTLYLEPEGAIARRFHRDETIQGDACNPLQLNFARVMAAMRLAWKWQASITHRRLNTNHTFARL